MEKGVEEKAGWVRLRKGQAGKKRQVWGDKEEKSGWVRLRKGQAGKKRQAWGDKEEKAGGIGRKRGTSIEEEAGVGR
jgi:hypothetical protein